MRLLKSAMMVLSGNVIDMACTFLRNVIFARLLGVQDFGIAATFGLLVTLLDITAQMGLQRMVIQARDADDPVLQSTVHTVQFGLGVLAGLIMLLIAAPYAILMATPGLVWAYAMLAIIPVLRSLAHLDTQRLQRHGRYGPATTRQILPPIIALIAIYPAYLWLGDYRVALVTAILQQATFLAVTHIGAEWPYRFGFDRAIIRRGLAFGWPLLLNSLLLYFVMNGERMIVASQFGLSQLGWFSAAVMLTMMPVNLIARTMQTVLLATMSKQQDDTAKLQRLFDLASSAVGLAGVGFTLGVALLGGPVLVLTFGHEFAPAQTYIALLAAMQSLRLVRAVPALVAMSRAETKNPLYANIVRGAFILLALGVAIVTRNLTWMIVCGIVGEFISTLWSGILVQRLVKLSARHFYVTLALSLPFYAAICLGQNWPWVIWLLPVTIGIVLWSSRNVLFEYRMLLKPARI